MVYYIFVVLFTIFHKSYAAQNTLFSIFLWWHKNNISSEIPVTVNGKNNKFNGHLSVINLVVKATRVKPVDLMTQ